MKLGFKIYVVVIFLFLWSNLTRADSSADILNYLNKGDQELYSNNLEQARNYYEKARLLAIQNNSEYNRFLSIYKIGFSLLHEEQKFLALAHFTDIEIEMTCKNAVDSALYLLVNTEIDILTYNTIKTEYNADEVDRKILKYKTYLRKEEMYRLMFLNGDVFFQRLEYKRAVGKYERLIGFTTSDNWLYENLFFKLAEANEGILEYPKAIEYYMALSNTDLKYVNQVKIYFNLGRDYYLMDDYKLALSYFNRVLQQKNTVSNNFFDILSYIWMGNCFNKLGDFSKVEKMYNKAEQLANSRRVSPDIIIPIYSAKINFYKYTNQNFECQNYIKRAFKYIENSTEMPDYLVSELYNQVSSYYFSIKEYKKVINLTDKFLKEKKGLTIFSYSVNTEWVEYVQLLDNKARSLHALWSLDSTKTNYLYDAFSLYKTILGYWERGLNNVVSETAKLELLKYTQTYYKHYFITLKDIYYVSGDKKLIGEAFNCIEHSKAYLFKDYLKESEALRYTNIPQYYIQLEAKLKKHIEFLQFYLNKGNQELTSDEEKKLFIIELPIIKVRYDSLIRVLESRFPEYYNLKYHERIFTLPELQVILSSDQIIVEYYIIESNLFILTISKNDIEFIECPVGNEFTGDIKKYRTLLQNYSPWSNYQSELNNFVSLSGKLYDLLIRPIEKTIISKRLIIVPDDDINLIPFETLVKPSKNNTVVENFGDLEYLVKTNAISLVYTVEQLFDKQYHLSACSRYIAFAPNYTLFGDSSIIQLPGAKDEVMLIGDYFKGKRLIDEKATKKNFLEKTQGYDIIHLALHTKINDFNPMHSQLLFSSCSKESKDNSLTIYEMYGIDFKAKLLVLSGCNTGSGEIKTGEGVMNLARAFFYAGIKNILVTQWAVSDRSSSTLMNSFYMYLHNGEKVDVALQKAKIDFLKNEDPVKLHPYYWAGYVAVGKTVGGSSDSLCVLKYYWVFLAIGFLFLGLILYKKRSG